MPPLYIPGEARALIAELGEPVPRVLLDRYFARVSARLIPGRLGIIETWPERYPLWIDIVAKVDFRR